MHMMYSIKSGIPVLRAGLNAKVMNYENIDPVSVTQLVAKSL
jgi:hypothetical protein